ncbi:MAG: PLP-dependent aminotransferase family protein, partial [Candidatus Atribacteria bacterium]|nr:PLP-dependent aminotransferase family protein [Candidatus Atribacteria bacterium]
MQIQSKTLFSKLATQMNDSSVSEILKVIQRPSVISLAGGMPDPKTFPIEELKEICAKIINKDSALALQYSSTDGYIKLREFLYDWLDFNRESFSKDNIIITSGSQQGLDLVSKVLLNPGDVVIVELPSYLAALNSFRSYGAELIGVPMDSEGIRLDLLENTLNELSKRGKTIKFIYTIVNFQNPAGVTMSLSRRRKILEIAKNYDLFILEDDPYGKLRFEGDPIPSIFSFDCDGRVISLGTFSKILCPGLRLAWLVANQEIIEK